MHTTMHDSHATAATPADPAVLTRHDPGAAVDDATVEAAARWLRDTVDATGRPRVVVGLSGGIDSAVVAFLAVRALGAARVTLVAMPYGLAAPARWAASTPDSLAHARLVADALPGVDFRVVDIAPAVDALALATGLAATLDEAVAPDANSGGPWLWLGNMKARQRAVTLRYFANALHGLVLGTENRTENRFGFFTIGGDEETDLEVLSPFLKAQVRALARRLGVPAAIVAKPPSADLWTGQTDEGELGIRYDDADQVLLLAERHADPTGDEARASAVAAGIAPAIVERVLARVRATAFKRAPRPTYERADRPAPGDPVTR